MVDQQALHNNAASKNIRYQIYEGMIVQNNITIEMLKVEQKKKEILRN